MNYDEYMNVVQENVIYWLKQGINPWQASWTTAKNGESKRRYSGQNAWFLTAAAARFFDGDPRFLTFDQVQKLGYRIKKGEHGFPAYFYQTSTFRVKKDENGDPVLDEKGNKVKEKVKIKPVFQVYTVFNAKQIEGMPEYSPTEYPDEDFDKKTADAILANSPVKILNDQLNQAFYSNKDDSIHLPHEKQFTSTAGYYSTVFHEMAHATGTEERLNRKSQIEYATERPKEELIAELSSVVLCNSVGLKYENANSAAYIASWASAMEKGSLSFKTLYDDVSKAVHYIKYPDNRERMHDEAIKNAEKKSTDIKVGPNDNEIMLTDGDTYFHVYRSGDKWAFSILNNNFHRKSYSLLEGKESLQDFIDKKIIAFSSPYKPIYKAKVPYRKFFVKDYGIFIDAGQYGYDYISKAGGLNYGKEFIRVVPIDEETAIVRHFTVSGKNAKASYVSKEEISSSQDILYQLGFSSSEYEKISFDDFKNKERSLDFRHWKWVEKNSHYVNLTLGKDRNSSVQEYLSLSDASYRAEENLFDKITPYTVSFYKNGNREEYHGEFDPEKHTRFLDSVTDPDLKEYFQTMQKLEEKESFIIKGFEEGIIEGSEDFKNQYLDYVEEQMANANTGKPVDWDNFPTNKVNHVPGETVEREAFQPRNDKQEQKPQIYLIPRYVYPSAVPLGALKDHRMPPHLFLAINKSEEASLFFDVVYTNGSEDKDLVISECRVNKLDASSINEAIKERVSFKNATAKPDEKAFYASVTDKLDSFARLIATDIREFQSYNTPKSAELFLESATKSHLIHVQKSEENGIDWTLYETDPKTGEILKDLDGGVNSAFHDVQEWKDSEEFISIAKPEEKGGYLELPLSDGMARVEEFDEKIHARIKKAQEMLQLKDKAITAYSLSRNDEVKEYYKYLADHYGAAAVDAHEGIEPQNPMSEKEFYESKKNSEKKVDIDRINSLAKCASEALATAREKDRPYLEYIIDYAKQASAQGVDKLPLPLSRKAFSQKFEQPLSRELQCSAPNKTHTKRR